MATIISDDFNRADSTTLGGNWLEASGDGQIKSNQLYAASTARLWNTTTVGSADYKVTITQNGDYNQWNEPCARATGTTRFNNCYFGYHQYNPSTTDDMMLFKTVNGTQTQLGSTYSSEHSGLHTNTISCQGSAIKFQLDGVDRVSATDTSHSLEGYHGVSLGGTFYADDYLVEDFNAGGEPPATAVKDLIGGGLIPFAR